MLSARCGAQAGRVNSLSWPRLARRRPQPRAFHPHSIISKICTSLARAAGVRCPAGDKSHMASSRGLGAPKTVPQWEHAREGRYKGQRNYSQAWTAAAAAASKWPVKVAQRASVCHEASFDAANCPKTFWSRDLRRKGKRRRRRRRRLMICREINLMRLKARIKVQRWSSQERWLDELERRIHIL